MLSLYLFFFFNDTATTEIYTLSLHDALPISLSPGLSAAVRAARVHGDRRGAERRNHHRAGDGAPTGGRGGDPYGRGGRGSDRKSTRLNSSHSQISYAVFCLKKKKNPPRRASPQDAHPRPSSLLPQV